MKDLQIKRKKKTKSKKIGITIILITIQIMILFTWFSKVATPKLVHVAELNINKYIEHIASDFKLFILEKNASDQFLNMKINEEGEIIGMNYEMVKIYELADKLTNSIENNLTNKEILNKYLNPKKEVSQEEGLLLFFPLGIVSDSIFLSNLGPKIPILINFVGSVFSNIKTRVKDYGINNALLEVYLDVSITYEILTPVTKEEKKVKYELLIDSKVIQGKIPNIYGGILENRSAFFEVPFS